MDTPDSKSNTSNKELEIFIEYLKRGTLLLDLQELDAFHFQVAKEDNDSKDLANIINSEGISPENYENRIRPKAVKIMESAFTPEKIKEMHEILQDVEVRYKENDEVSKIALASKLFLEDKNANHSFLPIAVARLLEDIYATFYIVE